MVFVNKYVIQKVINDLKIMKEEIQDLSEKFIKVSEENRKLRKDLTSFKKKINKTHE